MNDKNTGDLSIECRGDPYAELTAVLREYVGPLTLHDLIGAAVDAALRKCQNKRKQTAHCLGVSEKTIYNMIVRYGLNQPPNCFDRSYLSVCDKLRQKGNEYPTRTEFLPNDQSDADSE